MDSPNVMTSEKPSKRILPGTSIAVSIPKQGNVSLFYKGQVFHGPGKSNDGIYQSLYLDGLWKGGLDAPPICPTPSADPSRVAAISWSGGKEQRIYYTGHDNILQEYCYSASKGDQWYPGALLQKLKIKLTGGSSISAVHWYGEQGTCIRVYYQEVNGSGLQLPIKELRWSNSGSWQVGPTLVYALPGCGIAAVTYRLRDAQQIHVFYQSLELTLSELYYHEVHDEWLPGEKNMGIAGDSTPITAFGWNDGDVQEMQVYWRNKIAEAEIVGAKKSSKQVDPSKWIPISPVVGGIEFDDLFAVAQWDNSKHMRLYYSNDGGHRRSPLLELCNDDDAGWVPGATFGSVQ